MVETISLFLVLSCTDRVMLRDRARERAWEQPRKERWLLPGGVAITRFTGKEF